MANWSFNHSVLNGHNTIQAYSKAPKTWLDIYPEANCTLINKENYQEFLENQFSIIKVISIMEIHIISKKSSIILLIIFFVGIQFIYSQQDSSFTQLVIQGISKYRNELMQKDSGGLIVLGIIIKENKKVNWKDKKSAMQNYPSAHHNPEYNLKFLNKIYGDSSILTEFNIDVLRVYNENIEMIDCFRLDVLEDEYPFKIKKDSKFFNELSFYKIQDNETMLFIGASDYTMGKIASNIYNNLKIHTGRIGADFRIITDVEPDSTKQKNSTTKEKINYFDWESSHKENEMPDKIIIRGIPEFFIQDKKYIHSIKDNLRKNGKLFFLVPDPFLIEDKKIYQKNLSIQNKLFKRLSQFGFVLEEDLAVDNLILYKFRANPDKK